MLKYIENKLIEYEMLVKESNLKLLNKRKFLGLKDKVIFKREDENIKNIQIELFKNFNKGNKILYYAFSSGEEKLINICLNKDFANLYEPNDILWCLNLACENYNIDAINQLNDFIDINSHLLNDFVDIYSSHIKENIKYLIEEYPIILFELMEKNIGKNNWVDKNLNQILENVYSSFKLNKDKTNSWYKERFSVNNLFKIAILYKFNNTSMKSFSSSDGPNFYFLFNLETMKVCDGSILPDYPFSDQNIENKEIKGKLKLNTLLKLLIQVSIITNDQKMFNYLERRVNSKEKDYMECLNMITSFITPTKNKLTEKYFLYQDKKIDFYRNLLSRNINYNLMLKILQNNKENIKNINKLLKIENIIKKLEKAEIQLNVRIEKHISDYLDFKIKEETKVLFCISNNDNIKKFKELKKDNKYVALLEKYSNLINNGVEFNHFLKGVPYAGK